MTAAPDCNAFNTCRICPPEKNTRRRHLCSILHFQQMKENIISRMRVGEMLMVLCGSCWLAARDRCKQCLALLALDLPLSKLRGHRSFDGGTSTVICFVTGGELATWRRILV